MNIFKQDLVRKSQDCVPELSRFQLVKVASYTAASAMFSQVDKIFSR